MRKLLIALTFGVSVFTAQAAFAAWEGKADVMISLDKKNKYTYVLNGEKKVMPKWFVKKNKAKLDQAIQSGKKAKIYVGDEGIYKIVPQK